MMDERTKDEPWAARELRWRRELRRLRFDAEPIPVQVEKYRRVTIGLTAVAAGMAVLFLLVFAAFRRPDIAVVIDLVLFGPIVGLAWLDYRSLERKARAYEAEKRERDDPASPLR